MKTIIIPFILSFFIACNNTKDEESHDPKELQYEVETFYSASLPSLDSVRLYCYFPDGYDTDLVLTQIIMPDNGDSPINALNDWISEADKYGLCLVIPDFFAKSKEYNEDTYNKLLDVVDEIHDRIIDKYKLGNNKFNLCGNGEGANFVNSYLLFHESSSLNKAIIANLDWTELLDFDEFVENNDLGDSDLKEYFNKKVAIFLTDEETSSFEKGTDFFLSARTYSQEKEDAFNWSLKFLYNSSSVEENEVVAVADFLYGPYQNNHFTRGGGIEFFDSGSVFGNSIIPVFYYIPMEASVEDTKVQYILHGMGRNGYDYLCSWINSADEYKLFLIVPQFSKEDFSEMAYQQGGVRDDDGNFVEADSTTFELIEQVFTFVKEETPVKVEKYNIFGHSAGGQFVHRFLLFHPTDNLGRAVAANAGWYTFPDNESDFPYGIRTVPSRLNVSITDFYAKNLTILLGTADTLRTSNLRQTEKADLQGKNRLLRGQKFYNSAKEDARVKSCPFNWDIEFVEGVGHEWEGMSEGAAKLLYE